MRFPTYEETIRWLIPDVEIHQNRYARELDREVIPGCRWLDLGAGTKLHHGWYGESPARLAARATYLVGCDLLADNMRANPQLAARAVADVVRLPFGDASFTLITANMLLEHVHEPGGMFAEIARILAPGGKFVFVTPNRRHPAVWLLDKFLTPHHRLNFAVRWVGRPAHEAFPTRYEANTVGRLRHLAMDAGLVVARLEVFRSWPMFRSPLPAVALECLWIRLQARGPLQRLGSNLFGCLAKPPAA